MHAITIRPMLKDDIEMVYEVFTEHQINKSREYLIQCWEENLSEARITLLALYEGQFAGSLHVLATSYYPYFAAEGIPEINDFNVIAPLRRHGIGNQLMEAAEKIALDKYGIVGIGVGLYASYGHAQRIYAKRGYIPDGRGIMYKEKPVTPGTEVRVDDDLVLYFTKKRAAGELE